MHVNGMKDRAKCEICQKSISKPLRSSKEGFSLLSAFSLVFLFDLHNFQLEAKTRV